MTHRLRRIGAAEVIIAHRAPHETEPCALEHDLAAELHVAARGDVELERLRMHVGYHVVERVDALEDNDLVLAELDGLRRRLDAHLARELILRHEDTLALESMVKCLFRSSMSMQHGDSRSISPSGVRGTVAGSMVLK